MSNYGNDAILHVPLSFDFDIDVDDDGISYLVGNVFLAESEECEEWRVELDEVLDGLMDEYGDVDGYQHLYVCAHELARAAEVLREKAGHIEDSVLAVNDLFDLSDDGS